VWISADYERDNKAGMYILVIKDILTSIYRIIRCLRALLKPTQLNPLPYKLPIVDLLIEFNIEHPYI
jgi:hypothetical protein